MAQMVDEATRRKWRHVPNAISWSRLVLGVGVLVALVMQPDWLHDPWMSGWMAFAFFVVFVTDWFDGHIARRFDVTSKFGAMLDTTIDKVVVVAPVVWLATVGALSDNYALGWWIASLTFARELAASVGKFLARKMAGVDMSVQDSGRFKMFAQCAAIILTVWSLTRGELTLLVWGAAVGTGLSSIYEYVRTFLRARREVKAA